MCDFTALSWRVEPHFARNSHESPASFDHLRDLSSCAHGPPLDAPHESQLDLPCNNEEDYATSQADNRYSSRKPAPVQLAETNVDEAESCRPLS